MERATQATVSGVKRSTGGYATFVNSMISVPLLDVHAHTTSSTGHGIVVDTPGLFFGAGCDGRVSYR